MNISAKHKPTQKRNLYHEFKTVNVTLLPAEVKVLEKRYYIQVLKIKEIKIIGVLFERKKGYSDWLIRVGDAAEFLSISSLPRSLI